MRLRECAATRRPIRCPCLALGVAHVACGLGVVLVEAHPELRLVVDCEEKSLIKSLENDLVERLSLQTYVGTLHGVPGTPLRPGR